VEGEVDEEKSSEAPAVPVVEVSEVLPVDLDFESFPRCASWGPDVPLILHTHFVTNSAAPASTRQRRRCNNGDTGASSSGNRRDQDHGPRGVCSVDGCTATREL